MPRFSREELSAAVQVGLQRYEDVLQKPMLVRQRITSVDRGVRGPRWVSRTTFPAPRERDVWHSLRDAIRILGDGSEHYTTPTSAEVPVQWVAYRPGVSEDAPEAAMSERDKFDALTAASTGDLTIMYLFGGGHVLNSPASRRGIATTLSRLTGARCVIIQPRRGPQSPFPAQQLDTLHAYLTLIHPPPGSWHSPVDPKRLIIAGDSSGAQLALSLVQTLLTLHRHAPSLRPRFHAAAVALPLPAGMAVQSPGFDMLGTTLPSWTRAAPTDIMSDARPSLLPHFPRDAAWPASPPRAHFIADLSVLAHPLLSPLTAADWSGAPPMYLAVGGGERLADSAKFVAQSAARDGVVVVWDEYELMPHNWPMFLYGWPQSRRCLVEWAAACRGFVAAEAGKVRSKGQVWDFEPDGDGGRVARAVDVRSLIDISLEDVRRMMREAVARFELRARPAVERWKQML